MAPEESGATRSRLLDAAAELIAASPGQDVSLRAICDRVGVKMPTLYHFFGNKQGLLDAVVERGFDLYLAEKAEAESSGDPVQDLRQGWDTHVAFGLANPGFYVLMYGTVRPGYSPAPQSRPSELLRELTRRASEQGRLVVPAEQAAAHVLVTNIGVTLRQIILGEDRPLSVAVREGALSAITGTGPMLRQEAPGAYDLLEYAAANPEALGQPETQLFTSWLARLINLRQQAAGVDPDVSG
ncbi:MAG: TetR/AcrR family transcriptional regulator [Actinomycetales bacterium]